MSKSSLGNEGEVEKISETEISCGERKVERKSILDRSKNIFKERRQESFKLERETERLTNGVGWEEDCLMRAMIDKRGLEDTRIIDMILKR